MKSTDSCPNVDQLVVVAASAFDKIDKSALPAGMKSMSICKRTGMIAIVDDKYIHIFNSNQKHILSHVHSLAISNQTVVIVKWIQTSLYVLHRGQKIINKFKYNSATNSLELDAMLSDPVTAYPIYDFVYFAGYIITVHERKFMCVYMEAAGDILFMGYFQCKEMGDYGLDDVIVSEEKKDEHQIVIQQRGCEIAFTLKWLDSATNKGKPIGYTPLWTRKVPDDYIPALTTSSKLFGFLGYTIENEFVQSLIKEDNQKDRYALYIESFALTHFRSKIANVLYINWMKDYGINGALALCIQLENNTIVWMKFIDLKTWTIVDEILTDIVGIDILKAILGFLGC